MKKNASITRNTYALLALACGTLWASAAPLITLDPAANITDVYAFRSRSGRGAYLTTAMSVHPHEEPGAGVTKYDFDDAVLYEIHVALGADVAAGRATLSYQFRFNTTYKNQDTIFQSYLGVIQNVDDAAQNLTQRYTVTKIDNRTAVTTVLGTGVVPPNNLGNATPNYNQSNNGENPAKDGVATAAALDPYTMASLPFLTAGYQTFCGQRDDGFFGDLQSIFDLLNLRSPGKDSHGGFNVHTIALNIPVADLGGDQQIVGVYATTSRESVKVTRIVPGQVTKGRWVQVGRHGNPLFSDGFVATADKDLYSRTAPSSDATLFNKYALKPELAKLINQLIFGGSVIAVEDGRTDVVGAFIPDLIRVDLSTTPARLAGSGAGHPTNPDTAGFSRLGIFGNDVLTSSIQPGFGGGTIPGGWPNGRRFGDDVVDIVTSFLLSDLRGPLVIRVADGVDGVSMNDIGYNKAFPYAGTPLNGRNHTHP